MTRAFITGLLCAATLAAERAIGDSTAPELLLKKHCSKCHGAEKQKGDFRIDSIDALLKGGESGPAIVRGTPGQSLLLESLAAEADNHMPPKSQATFACSPLRRC